MDRHFLISARDDGLCEITGANDGLTYAQDYARPEEMAGWARGAQVALEMQGLTSGIARVPNVAPAPSASWLERIWQMITGAFGS